MFVFLVQDFLKGLIINCIIRATRLAWEIEPINLIPPAGVLLKGILYLFFN